MIITLCNCESAVTKGEQGMKAVMIHFVAILYSHLTELPSDFFEVEISKDNQGNLRSNFICNSLENLS